MEATQTETKAETKKRRQTPRPYRFFVVVKHRQLNAETQKVDESEFLEFADKSALREGLALPKYEGADLRIVRGYEMQAKSKRHISLS